MRYHATVVMKYNRTGHTVVLLGLLKVVDYN